jgi:hypothetical protein
MPRRPWRFRPLEDEDAAEEVSKKLDLQELFDPDEFPSEDEEIELEEE